MDILNEKEKSLYRLSKESEIPYSTLYELTHDYDVYRKCSADTLFRLSKALGISMDYLYERFSNRLLEVAIASSSFDLYRSQITHDLNRLGDQEFFHQIISDNTIEHLFWSNLLHEAYYLYATVLYLARINHFQLPVYSWMKKEKIKNQVIFPSGVFLKYKVYNNPDILRDEYRKSIPEFRKFGFVERDLKNAESDNQSKLS